MEPEIMHTLPPNSPGAPGKPRSGNALSVRLFDHDEVNMLSSIFRWHKGIVLKCREDFAANQM